MKDLGK